MVSLRLLQLPMFKQLNDLLLLSKLYHDKENALPLIETYEHQYGRVKSRFFKIPKLRTEKFRENFYFRTAKIVINLPEEIDFSQPLGLKKRTLSFMWDRLMLNFNERIECTWTIFCDCSDCRKQLNQDQKLLWEQSPRLAAEISQQQQPFFYRPIPEDGNLGLCFV